MMWGYASDFCEFYRICGKNYADNLWMRRCDALECKNIVVLYAKIVI